MIEFWVLVKLEATAEELRQRFEARRKPSFAEPEAP